MAQTITDFNTFLQDAKEAVSELADFVKREEALRQEESRLERSLETEKKTVADSINHTVKRRREEISSSYDNEIVKIQDKLKKARAKREKAKSLGIQERIEEETSELHIYNRELTVRMKTLFQKDRVPRICRSSYYYALYFTRGLKEFFALILTIAVCFLAVPYGIYAWLPQKKTIYLVIVYFVCILVFGGLYTIVGNMTRGGHMGALREGRTIRNLITSNNRKIRTISHSIKKDKDEAIYNLEKFDDEIAQLDQDMNQMTGKKKDALNTFENVTKTIITDEIIGNGRAALDGLTAAHEEASKHLRYTENMIKEKNIYITDTYEIYVGKEFLSVEKLEELRKIMESGTAVNISEAIEVYKNKAK